MPKALSQIPVIVPHVAMRVVDTKDTFFHFFVECTPSVVFRPWYALRMKRGVSGRSKIQRLTL